MKVVFNKPHLVISAASIKQWPESDMPEIIMAGKSNVGKSSLINALVNRKNLAYVGQTPGKTRLLNFYNLDDTLMLVDAPGYGYAKRSKSEAIDYGKLMETYFKQRKNVEICILILDIRHNPSQDDLVMYDYLSSLDLPFLVILTKSDKLSYSGQLKALNEFSEILEMPKEDLIVFSGSKKTGVDKIWERITNILKASN